MSAGDHAILGASSAQRWMACPGSVRLGEGLEAPESSYARAGTRAHRLAAVCIDADQNAFDWLGRRVDGEPVDPEMADAVQLFVDVVRPLAERALAVHVKRRFSLAELDPPGPMFGTADVVIVEPGLLRVLDFKFGAGVVVEVERNPQLLYYGLGAHLSLPPEERAAIETVELTIVQPRAPHDDGPVRSWSLPLAELLAFGDELIAAARRTQDPDAPLATGLHCKFCPAKPICPALRELALETAQADFAAADAEELAELLRTATILKPWIEAVFSHASSLALRGTEIPGWTLRQGLGRRRWADEAAAAEILEMEGLGPDDIAPRRLASPRQVELAAKRAAHEARTSPAITGVIEGLVERPAGGVTLVPTTTDTPGSALSAPRPRRHPGDDFVGVPLSN